MDGDDAKGLADGTSDVVVAATQAATTDPPPGRKGIGLRELLITIMAPTLALFGVAIGVIGNTISEANAREREDELRRAELVLPVYRDVINAEDELETAVRNCARANEAWARSEFDSEAEREAAALVREACDTFTIEAAFDKLDTALERSLLVSDRDLLDAAEGYRAAQETYLLALFDYAYTSQLIIDDSVVLSEAEWDEIEDEYARLDAGLDELERAKDELVTVVRDQVLP